VGGNISIKCGELQIASVDTDPELAGSTLSMCRAVTGCCKGLGHGMVMTMLWLTDASCPILCRSMPQWHIAGAAYMTGTE
jgi:hypothetical protein